MALVDDARRLLDIGVQCDACTGSPLSGHLDGCPMPRVVAALEAAQRLVGTSPVYVTTVNGQSVHRCAFCELVGTYWRADGFDHAPDCPWLPLVAAMSEGE